jgi:hypothetical protein
MRRDEHGQLKDEDGFLVSGLQPHVNARGVLRLCTVVDVKPWERRAGVLRSRGLALRPIGQSAASTPRHVTCRPRGAGRPAGLRGARPASRGGDSGDDGPGEPEPGETRHLGADRVVCLTAEQHRGSGL